jgi:hypothetical protein
MLMSRLLRPIFAAGWLQVSFIHSLSTQTTRSRFLSSSAAALLASTSVVVAYSQPDECMAAPTPNIDKNPRYIESDIDYDNGTNLDGTTRITTKIVRRLTGDSTPYTFPVKPIKLVQDWPADPPFKPEDFSRADSSPDDRFYSVPKLVYHIDEPAVAALTQYYRKNIAPKSDILDICSSWVSHYPVEFPDTMGKICATGISELELRSNNQLTGGYKAADLNVDPKIPYPDNSFDVVTCVVSIDYLVDPINVLKEVYRVLRPGGKAILSQSNRCFPTKAIALWLKLDDHQHAELINGFFQYAGGFEPRKAFDITATLPDNGYRDPMFVVEATKKK